jgi:cytochrome P450
MTSADVKDITFPFRRTTPLVPPTIYHELREGPPRQVSLKDGSKVWLVTRHADVCELLTDDRISSDHTKAGFPQVLPVPPVPGVMSFIRMDDPDHARLRTMLVRDFSARQINTMRPGIENIVDDLLERMAQGPNPADLVDAFTLGVPTRVLCQLLGVPYADHEFFEEKTRTIAALSSSPQDGAVALAELSGYLSDLVLRKQSEPGDDVLSRLVTNHLAAGDLSVTEVVAITRLLLTAGFETTAQTLSLSVLSLLQAPAQLDDLKRNPGLIGSAVHELIRFQSVVQGGARVATADIDLADIRIRAGEGVIYGMLAANNDDQVFPDAGALDLRRDSRRHLAFGYGIHQCLGQYLARVELEIALGKLFAAFPTLTLAAPIEEIPFRVDMLIYGLYELPVTW